MSCVFQHQRPHSQSVYILLGLIAVAGSPKRLSALLQGSMLQRLGIKLLTFQSHSAAFSHVHRCCHYANNLVSHSLTSAASSNCPTPSRLQSEAVWPFYMSSLLPRPVLFLAPSPVSFISSLRRPELPHVRGRYSQRSWTLDVHTVIKRAEACAAGAAIT